MTEGYFSREQLLKELYEDIEVIADNYMDKVKKENDLKNKSYA